MKLLLLVFPLVHSLCMITEDKHVTCNGFWTPVDLTDFPRAKTIMFRTLDICQGLQSHLQELPDLYRVYARRRSQCKCLCFEANFRVVGCKNICGTNSKSTVFKNIMRKGNTSIKPITVTEAPKTVQGDTKRSTLTFGTIRPVTHNDMTPVRVVATKTAPIITLARTYTTGIDVPATSVGGERLIVLPAKKIIERKTSTGGVRIAVKTTRDSTKKEATVVPVDTTETVASSISSRLSIITLSGTTPGVVRSTATAPRDSMKKETTLVPVDTTQTVAPSISSRLSIITLSGTTSDVVRSTATPDSRKKETTLVPADTTQTVASSISSSGLPIITLTSTTPSTTKKIEGKMKTVSQIQENVSESTNSTRSDIMPRNHSIFIASCFLAGLVVVSAILLGGSIRQDGLRAQAINFGQRLANQANQQIVDQTHDPRNNTVRQWIPAQQPPEILNRTTFALEPMQGGPPTNPNYQWVPYQQRLLASTVRGTTYNSNYEPQTHRRNSSYEPQTHRRNSSPQTHRVQQNIAQRPDQQRLPASTSTIRGTARNLKHEPQTITRRAHIEENLALRTFSHQQNRNL